MRPAPPRGRRWPISRRHLGVARDEVFAIGDNHNDVDMLRWAGTAVVMGNAEPDVLALGLPVTAPNTEAGVAQALRRLRALGFGLSISPSP